MAWHVLLVAAGAAIGAPLRYLVDRFLRTRYDTPFPWGTLVVNAAGSALLGFLTGLPADPLLTSAVGAGFCGALTTYSSFGYEILRLVEDGRRFFAVTNIAANLVGGLGAAYLGLAAADAITAIA